MTIEHSAETRARPPLYRHLYAQVLAAIAGITGLAKVGPIAGKASLIPDLDFGTCRPPRGHQRDAVGCGQCLSIRPRSMPRRSPAVWKRRKNS